MDIRPMRPEDRETVLEMMRDFYASPAMIVNGGEAVYRRNIEACLDESFPFV